MRLTVINIANKMPSWIDEGCNEYLVRINHGKYSCKMIEIKADKNPHKNALENMAREAEKIRKVIPAGAFVVVLDERGSILNSQEFAKRLDSIATLHSNIAFIIGGADGTHPDLKRAADLCLSFSSFTYPHALVRVIVLEQIYRAITILEKHPYHRE